MQRVTGVIPLCDRRKGGRRSDDRKRDGIGQVHRETGGASVVPKTDRLPKSDFLCFFLNLMYLLILVNRL